MKKFIKSVIFLGIAGLLFSPVIAQALTTLTFYNITGNNDISAAIGEAQARVDVEEVFGFDQVDFRFYNLGPENMSIEGIYFDDGAFFSDIDSIIGDPDLVSFEIGASPGDLPGGESISPPFEATEFLVADSNPPTYTNGVNPGEEVTIRFNLLADVTYADVLRGLSLRDEPHLRIGIHVQGFDIDDQSESFVNNPVPEPGTLFIFLGFLVVGMPFKRYFKGV